MLNKSKKLKIFDSDALKNFHKRIFFSIIVFAFCYFIAIFRIADVMVFEFANSEPNKKIKNIDRGKIYDRNGQLLATNIKSYSLYANTKKIQNKEQLAQKLSLIIGKNKNQILKKLNTNKNFIYLKRNISPREHQRIIQLGEINLQTELLKKRIYPFQSVGSHIVGFVDIDNKGIAGVESGYDTHLNLNKDLYLTIDINLQNAVRSELIKTIKSFKAESGSAIILNIKSSEILSLVNFPDFDPNNYQESNDNQRLNRVLQSNYEMGSTFKPLTVAMGIDKNLLNKNMSFDVSKPIKHITDWNPCDCSLSLKEVIVKSSNIGTAKIANLIGKENQKKFFNLIGFNEPVDIKLSEATMPLGNKNNWGKVETMTIGFGHGFAITPMHLAVAYGAILNYGKKMSPQIILTDSNKEYRQVIKKETSEYIASLLRAVINESKFTGPRVKIEGYDIGGKTGTSELPDKNGKYDSDLNRTIFIGALPMSNPKYLVLTFIDKPKRIKEANYSITSATINAPLVKNIISRMIEILKIPKNKKINILNAATTQNYNSNNAIN